MANQYTITIRLLASIQPRYRSLLISKGSLIFPFYSHIHIPLTFAIIPSNCESVLHFENFVISKVLHNWDQQDITFGNWLFSFSIILWRLIQFVVCTDGLFFFLSGVPRYRCITICLTIHPFKYIWVVSYFGLLQIKLP